MKARAVMFGVVLLALAGLVACGTMAPCKEMTGFPKTTCEVKAVVQVIEANQPQAFAVLDAAKAFVSPDVAQRIGKVEVAWVPLRNSMDSLVSTMEAGQTGDVAGVVGNAVAFYVELSDLVKVCGGGALPGLPRTASVNAEVVR